MVPKKARRWICGCGRINPPEESVCGFCQREKIEKPVKAKTTRKSPIKKKKAFDEVTLWPVFSLYIRLRDTDSRGYGKCFTCPRVIHYSKGDCGHGMPRQHKGVKYNEFNNHLQCKHCNGFEGGRREVYRDEMDRRYGRGTWDKMELASRTATKLGRAEVLVMAAHYQKEVGRLLATKIQ